MNTRQKILEKANELFNTQGVQSTTLRQIAQALGMSQGNLNYHFKTKQDIVEALYLELVAKMDVQVAALTQPFSLLSTLFRTAEQSMQLFYAYRFFLRDIYVICKENERIRTHYLQLQEIRKGQFYLLFEAMKAKEILRPEALPREYERLYERMAILGDNWINASELFRREDENPISYYLELLFEMIFPYLTERGRATFHSVRQGGK